MRTPVVKPLNKTLLFSVLLWPFSFPSNLPIIEFLFFLVIVFHAIHRKALNTFILLGFAFFIPIILSDFTSSLVLKEFSIIKAGFYIKYLMILFLLIFLVNIDRFVGRNLQFNPSLFILVFISVSLIEFIYNFPKFMRLGSPGEITFNNVTDSHLYSAIISLCIILLFGEKKSYSRNLALILAIVAMFMTGSRTGILTLAIYGMLQFNVIFKLVYKNAAWFLIFAIFLNYYFGSDFFEYVSKAFNRALNFDLVNDKSSVVRFEKLQLAFSETGEKWFLLGSGPMHSDDFWYDNNFAATCAHMGLFSSILFLLYLFGSQHFAEVFDFQLRAVLFVQYFLSDYFFTTKYIFCLIFIAIILTQRKHSEKYPN